MIGWVSWVGRIGLEKSLSHGDGIGQEKMNRRERDEVIRAHYSHDGKDQVAAKGWKWERDGGRPSG